MANKEVLIDRLFEEPEWKFLNRIGALMDRPHVLKASVIAQDDGEIIQARLLIIDKGERHEDQ